MRTQARIEADIEELKHLIRDAEQLNDISKFAGADILNDFLGRTRDFYISALQRLDEGDPALNREYAKRKACLTLINSIITGLDSAEEKMLELKHKFLSLNEELQNFMDKQKERDKNNF